ncbi:MAG: hypothetical protein MR627_06370 [Prevotella sp.]|nr:hypothetical protein [Prevotella sp.]
MSFKKSLPPSHLSNVQTSLTLLSVCRRLSIVERLGGFWCCKGKAFIGIAQGFWKKINVQGECKKASLLVIILPSRSHFYAKNVQGECKKASLLVFFCRACFDGWKIDCIFANKKGRNYGSNSVFTLSNEDHRTDGTCKV